MKKIIKRWAVPVLTVIFVSIFPAVFLYGNNSNEADIQDVLEPMLLFAAGALVFFGVNALISRSPSKSAVVTVLFTLVFENFAGLENLLLKVAPSLRYWHTTAIFAFVLVHIAAAVYRYLSKEMEFAAVSVLCLVFGALTVINCVTAIPGEINKWNAEELRKSEFQQSQNDVVSGTSQDMPNIYLLIFDEYAGFQQIQKYYHYDNNVLKEFLNDHGFTISLESHNESIMTSTITTNLVNLEYVVDNNTPEAEKEVLRHNGKLFTILSELGYEIRKLTTMGFYGQDYIASSGQNGHAVATAGGETIDTILYKKTAVYPFLHHEVKISFDELDFLTNPENIPQEPAFSLMHISLPHTPFYYDEYGGENSYTDWVNWNDDKIYLGQYKYTTKLMMNVLDVLCQNDPNSLIIVMSDHGARASTDLSLFMEKFELNDMNNILNAFYYCGEDLSQYTDKSAVNTLRLLLNHALGTNYTELEVPVDTYEYK